MSGPTRGSTDPRRFDQKEDDIERRMESLFSTLLGFQVLPGQISGLTGQVTGLGATTTALSGQVTGLGATTTALSTRVTTLEGAPAPTTPSPLTIITSTQGTAYRLTKSGGGGGLQVCVSLSLTGANPVTWTFPATFSAIPVIFAMLPGTLNIAAVENPTLTGADLRRWQYGISPVGFVSTTDPILAVAIGTW